MSTTASNPWYQPCFVSQPPRNHPPMQSCPYCFLVNPDFVETAVAPVPASFPDVHASAPPVPPTAPTKTPRLPPTLNFQGAAALIEKKRKQNEMRQRAKKTTAGVARKSLKNDAMAEHALLAGLAAGKAGKTIGQTARMNAFPIGKPSLGPTPLYEETVQIEVQLVLRQYEVKKSKTNYGLAISSNAIESKAYKTKDDLWGLCIIDIPRDVMKAFEQKTLQLKTFAVFLAADVRRQTLEALPPLSITGGLTEDDVFNDNRLDSVEQLVKQTDVVALATKVSASGADLLLLKQWKDARTMKDLLGLFSRKNKLALRRVHVCFEIDRIRMLARQKEEKQRQKREQEEEMERKIELEACDAQERLDEARRMEADSEAIYNGQQAALNSKREREGENDEEEEREDLHVNKRAKRTQRISISSGGGEDGEEDDPTVSDSSKNRSSSRQASGTRKSSRVRAERGAGGRFEGPKKLP